MSKTNPYHYPGDGRHGDGNIDYRNSARMLRRLLLANKREADKREGGTTNRPTVYVIQRHRSRSGMLRHLALFVSVDGDMWDVTRLAADVLGWKLNADRDGIKVPGTGMDMHFHTVYTLGRKLYPNGNANRRDGGYMLRDETL